MQNCCLEGCESYKFVSKQKIVYFRFPIFNKPLLKKWLNQIKIPNWKPSPSHLICSTHFHVDDIIFTNKFPKLKPNAIPMIFPLKHFQNIYADEQYISKKAVQNKHKKSLVANNKLNLISPKINQPVQKSSVVLLCTPSNSTNISALQIDSMPTSNMTMKKIPLKNSKVQTSESSNMNPYLLIVSDKQEINPSKKYSTNKRPLLKIQIDKIVKKKKNEATINQRPRSNNYINEVEIDNVSSSQTIVFQLDTSTGTIIVKKKDKLQNKNDNCETNCKKNNNLDFTCNNLKENETEIDKSSNDIVNNHEIVTLKNLKEVSQLKTEELDVISKNDKVATKNKDIKDNTLCNTGIIEKNQEKVIIQTNSASLSPNKQGSN